MRAALVALAALAAGSPSFAQEAPAGDDWDLIQEPGRVAMAMLDFGSNALAVRCQQNVLEVVLTGVPAIDAASRYVTVTLGSRAPEQRVWTTQAGATFVYAAEPERLARQAREGGVLDVRLEPATDAERVRQYRFPLPPSPAAINQVLLACGKKLEDDRDALPRAGRVRWASRPIPYYPDNSTAVRAGTGRVDLSCIVADNFGLRDCRVESEEPALAGFGASALRAARGARLDGSGDAAAVPGSVVVFPVAFSRQ